MKTKMRNTLLVLIGLSSVAFAGEPVINASTYKISQDGEKCFNESTHIINLGVGLSGRSYYKGGAFGRYSTSPAFSLSYEQPWPKKLGPGFLGVGAYVGYQTSRYRYDYDKNSNFYYYEHKWNHTVIAARGVYHWDVLNSEKAEVYGGALIGLRIQTYNYASNNPNPDDYYKLNEGSVYPVFSAFAGARWYFAKNVAVYGEVGSGVSYLTGGLSFKF